MPWDRAAPAEPMQAPSAALTSLLTLISAGCSSAASQTRCSGFVRPFLISINTLFATKFWEVPVVTTRNFPTIICTFIFPQISLGLWFLLTLRCVCQWCGYAFPHGSNPSALSFRAQGSDSYGKCPLPWSPCGCCSKRWPLQAVMTNPPLLQALQVLLSHWFRCSALCWAPSLTAGLLWQLQSPFCALWCTKMERASLSPRSSPFTTTILQITVVQTSLSFYRQPSSWCHLVLICPNVRGAVRSWLLSWQVHVHGFLKAIASREDFQES